MGPRKPALCLGGSGHLRICPTPWMPALLSSRHTFWEAGGRGEGVSEQTPMEQPKDEQLVWMAMKDCGVQGLEAIFSFNSIWRRF